MFSKCVLRDQIRLVLLNIMISGICEASLCIHIIHLNEYPRWYKHNDCLANLGRYLFCKLTHPGTPPDSMWLANVTSSLHTSNCHLRKPRTPHRTFPVCIPIRMSTLNPVASRTNLKQEYRLCNRKGDCMGRSIQRKMRCENNLVR